MPYQGFYRVAMPWLEAAQYQARASLASLRYLNAKQCGDEDGADSSKREYDKNVALAEAPRVTLADGRKISAEVGNGQYAAIKTRAISDNLAAVSSTNLSTWGGNTIENIADKSDATLFWSGQAPTIGSFIQRDLGAPHTLSSVALTQGQTDADTDGDILKQGEIQVSLDGVSWRIMGGLTGTVTRLTFEQPVAARYLRVVAMAPQTNWW